MLMREPAPRRKAFGHLFSPGKLVKFICLGLMVGLLAGGGVLARWGAFSGLSSLSVPPAGSVGATSHTIMPVTTTPPAPVATNSPTKEYIYLGSRLIATEEPAAVTTPTNPIDDAEFFVRQHYRDFLNREGDASGIAFWTNEIKSCNSDPICIEVKRINVSTAFFLSIEFQNTGYLLFRFNRETFFNTLPKFAPFIVDAQKIGNGVVVGQTGWESQLEANKQSFALEWVKRPEFIALFPTTMSPDQFVDRLFANAEVSPTTDERNAALSAYGTGGDSGRAAALRNVADSGSVYNKQYNPAFVLMQYFGYLRRNPDDFPDTDLTGFNFWLRKLDSFSLPGEDVRNPDVASARVARAEMVKAFINSSEYRDRFGKTLAPAFVSKMTAGATTVKAGTITSTFYSVASDGTMIVAQANPWSVGSPPAGYAFYRDVAFNVSATAAVTAPYTVTFDIAWEVNNATEFAALRVLHMENGVWVDRTVLSPDAPAPDFINRKISGRANTLGMFAIGRLINANHAPLVSLTQPISGEVLQSPASVNLNASASDADGDLSKVQFYQGDTLLGEDSVAPYSFSLANLGAGNYAFRAKAIDSKGAATFSTYANVSVVDPPAPSGSLSAVPGQINVCDGTGLGVANLSWTSTATSTISLRAGAPGGVELTSGGPTGSFTTAKTIDDGTTLYLQNTTGGRPLTSANTLATMVLHVTSTGCAPSGRTNFALATNGGVATASSSQTNYQPSRAINGERKGINYTGTPPDGAGWAEVTGSTTHWLQVDLTNGNGGAIYRNIDEIDVFSPQDNYTNPVEPTEDMTFNSMGLIDFDLQYWTGTAWANVPTNQVRNNNNVWRKVTFTPVTTNKIRISIIRSASPTSYLIELEAWGRATSDTVWVEDTLPAGAGISGDQEGWNWTNANPAPFSGASAHQSNLVAGMHQHYFYGATQGLRVNAGDSLFTYVYLDPANIPSGMMLQWDDGTWEHRAYWGADALNWGFAGTESRRYMGAMPPAGQWIRLEVPASMVGLEGRTVTGMAFTLIDGRATWDRAGKAGFNRRNVALASNGATATASSLYNSGFPASSVINGDRKGAVWGSGGGWNDATPNSWPDWVEVDLPTTKSINEIDVFTIQDNYTNPVEPTETQTFTVYGNTSFRVQFWNGTTWVTVPGGAVTGNNNVWRRFAFAPVTTSKIRVMIDDAADHAYGRVTELEAYESIANQLPVAQPSGPYAASAGATIGFYGGNSSDPDGNIASYSWNFGDGTFGSGPNPTHAYAAAGTYTVTLTVVDSAGDTASAQTTANITAPATNGATFISQAFPSSVVAGRAYYASITMRNTGTSTWSTSGNFSLGSQNPQDNQTWGMARVALPGTIAPGADATFIITFVAPSTPGTYNFQWRMVQDYVAWFGDYTGNQSVVVKAPTPPSALSMVAQWKFDEGSGTTVADATGNGNTGALVSGPTWSAGKVGSGSLSFDGVDDRVTVAANSTLLDVGNNFTISFWAYPRSTHQIDAEGYTWGGTSGQRYAFAPRYGPGNDAGAGISVGTNGVSVYEHSGNYMPASLVYQGTLSGWTHITLVYENKQPRLYINGVLVRTGLTSSRSNIILHPQDMGGMSYGYYDGLLDDVRVYNQVLSANDIQTLATESAFVSQSIPTSMTAGQTYPVTVTMRNTGTTTWTSADNVALGTQNPQDNTTWGSTPLGNGRVNLPATVAPGSDATFTFNVTAPSTPGTYNFQRRMVRGASGWFGEVTQNVVVTVNATPPTATATFVKSDATTKGNWQGVYGNDGYRLAGEAAFFPNYAQITTSGRNDYTWAATSTDVRAVQKASNGADRIAACWYNSTEFYINVEVTDGWPHQVALYSLDWDGNNARQQRIDVLDVGTGTVLDSRSLTAYSGGQYLVWNIKGSVTFRVTNTGPTASNAVVSGLFLDTPPVAQWKFDESSGVIAADASGNGNTGTLQNGPTWSAGKLGTGSLNLDGIDDRVQITSGAALSNITNNFTVAFWANPRSTHEIDPESVTGVAGVGGQRWVYEPINKPDPDAGAGISVGTNGVSVYEHAAGYMPATLVYPATISGWTHIAVVYENKQPRLYINGVPVKIGQRSPRANVYAQPPEIGGMSYGCFDGQIDEMRVYNQPLGTEQIRHLAQGSPLKNLALGRPATQSSTYPNTTVNLSADRAVDGNTNGDWNALSITHTNNDNQAWWQVDLGYAATIQNISIWNRTDCCSTRLSNFYVFVSDVPFAATDVSVQSQPGVSTYSVSGTAGSPTLLPINRTGRYVRVQLSGLNYLSLAEVQVWGMPKNGPVFGDDFNDNALDWSRWVVNDPASPTTAREQNQRFEISLQPNVAGYNGVTSSAPQSLVNRYAQVQLVQPVSMGGWAETGLQLIRDGSNYYNLSIGAGSLVMDAWTGGVRDRTVLNFDPVNHRFWRIQHDPNSQTVSFMLSADGQNWTVGKTVAVTFPLNSLKLNLFGGAWGTGNGAPGTAIYDDVRIVTNGPGSIAALRIVLPGMQLAAGGAFADEDPILYLCPWWKVL
ncbi:MAG TPA: LamG-like jellyroll fold domain-containing protein [Pyrinomonadaceae bacterium]